MSVTITACANSTPPAGTVVATCSIGGENYQLFIQTDAAGNTIGVNGSPLFASISNLAGSAAGSPLFVSQNNMTGSAAGSPTFVSITNLSGSVAGSPLFASITNTVSASIGSGSLALLAGANVIGTASVIQSTPTGIGNAWPTKITDGTDIAAVDSASRLLVSASLTDGLTVTSASVTVVNNGTGSPVFTRITDGTDTAAIDSASRLLVSASLTDGLTVTSASVTVVNNGTGSPLFSKLTDGTDSVAVDSASRLLVSASLTDGLSVTAASVTIVNNSTACVLYTSACITNLAGSAAGSPLFASITNSPSVVVGSGSIIVNTSVASPLLARLTDGTDAVAVDAASRLLVSASLTDGLSVTAASVTIVNNSTACVIYTSACVTNLAGSAAGSPLFASITNLAGSAAGSPLFTSITNLSGSASGSPLFVSACLTNLAGSAAGSPLFVVANNLAGSAAGSPIFSSITNLAGSAAGSPLFVSACITNLTGSAAGSPLFARLSDGTDTVAIDSASRQLIAISDGTNAYGMPASPLSQAGQGQTMYWAGSMLTIKQIDLSSSISGCTAVIASAAGIAIVIVNATFTTSSCQFIGWVACGNGGAASATVQTRMPFGTNGGMDAKRSPDSYLWAFPSGSFPVLTTTSACVVAGTINYISVAS